MERLKLLSKISFKYWRCHSTRFLTFAFSVILGVAMLNSVALLIRSEKSLVLDEGLDTHGNYDLILYEMERSMLQTLVEIPEIDCTGCYYEMGYAGAPGSETVYKAAAYADQQSEELYHMTCIRGGYPRNDNEIAVDSSTASALGIAPYPGETVVLSLYDQEQKILTEQKFVVSGIFDVINEGRQYRYKRYNEEMEEAGYEVPLIIMSPVMNDIFRSRMITAYIQTEDEYDALAAIEEAVDGEISWSIIRTGVGRKWAYEYILGAGEVVAYRYGDLNFQNLQQAIQDGNVFQDFYSSVLIPVISSLILIVILLALFSFLRSIVTDRLEQIAILRLQGLTTLGAGLYLMADLLVWVAVFTLFGLLIGSGLHVLLISAVNSLLQLRLPLGFVCSEYVQAVTVNPYGYAAGVMAGCTILAVLLSVWQIVRKTPILLLREPHGKKHTGTACRKKQEKNWLALSDRALMLHDHSVLFMMIILMGSVFFGYSYFRALAEKNNNELKNMLEAQGLGQWDYVAEKPDNIDRFGTNAESRHDCGLDKDAFQELLQHRDVLDSYAMLVNPSTRLAYIQGTESEAVRELLADCSIRRFAPSEEEYANACYEAELVVLQQMGYFPEEAVYEVPTVGIPWEQLEALESYRVAGELNREKLAAGEEIVVAVTEENREAAIKAFPVGSSLPLSDILLSEEEDAVSFIGGAQTEVIAPAYSKDVMMPAELAGGGEAVKVNLKAYAFGSRLDIDTRVGAIVVIDDAETAKRCMVTKGEVYRGDMGNGGAEYGVNLLCLDTDAFTAWGLPDQRYTKAGIRVRNSVNMEELDRAWYQLIADSNGMYSYTAMNIKSDMNAGRNRVMCIYYAVMAMLILVTMCAIGMQLYSGIRRKSMDIAYMRAVGLSISQLARVIIRQNIFYPVIGAVCAVIPAAVCQCFFFFIQKNLAGNFMSIADERLPWWFNIPYRYNLFAYHPLLTLLLLFLIAVLLMAAVTIPQLIYIRRMQVVEDLEKVTF